MRKINLQLFAVVDTYKDLGKNPGYEYRKKDFEEYFGETYTGSAEQNIRLEKYVKENGANPSKSSAPSTPTNTSAGGASNTNTLLPVSGNGTQLAQSALSKTFTPSASYQSAMAYTNDLLAQLSSGRTSYTDQIKGMMDQIMNREDFKYDADSDMLFQQYLSSSMATGKQAMQDTMGQAAALTGGYGSTYATSAGNQMYNAYIQDAYNNLPEYYQMALEAYQMEGDEMYRQLGMLNDADATEYGRLYNAWSANNTHAQQLYQQEYGQYSDEVNNAFNLAQFVNSNYWNEKDNEYRYASLKQSQDQFEEEMKFKNKQFLTEYDLNANGIFDAVDQAMINNQKTSNSNGNIKTVKREDGTVVGVDFDNIPKTVSTNASNYDNNGELSNYLKSQVEAGIITEDESNYLYITNMKSNQEDIPLDQRNWTMIDDGGGNWGIDRNAYVEDEFGNPYRLGELFRELKKIMPNKEAREYIEELQKKCGIV